jgi:uncharacterized protein YdeI (BOF family)
MKAKTVLLFSLIGIFLVGIFYFLSKKSTEASQWDAPLDFFSDNMENYHNASVGANDKKSIGNKAVYIDFSLGIVHAYNNQTNKDVIDAITQKMVNDSVNFFGLGKSYGSNGIGNLNFNTGRNLFEQVTSPSSYTDKMAPIQMTLDKIVSSKNDAMLITDFEEYTPDVSEVLTYAYATPSFKKWLQDGNSITFFYSKFDQNFSGPDQKNLYFVIFNYGRVNENSFLSKFNDAIKGRNLPDLKRFDLNTTPFAISNNYGGEELTGLSPELDEGVENDFEIGNDAGVVVNYFNGYLKNKQPFESIEFGMSLNNLYEDYFSTDKKFLNKLFLDASNKDTYIFEDLSVELTDVTQDYIHYVKCNEAKKNVPEMGELDQTNKKVWSKKDNENSIIDTCYIKNTKKIKNEYLYKYKGGEIINEIFDIDRNVFKGQMVNTPKKVELKTIFHPNFKMKFKSQKPIILRLDYIINKSDINYKKIDDFKWKSIIPGSNGKLNTSLYESIRNTLQEVKPKRILYSYYMKLEPNIQD